MNLPGLMRCAMKTGSPYQSLQVLMNMFIRIPQAKAHVQAIKRRGTHATLTLAENARDAMLGEQF